jgi:hypothetical protein
MDLIRLASPAWPLREYVRLYAHREVRVGGTAVVHPVPARAFPILEFVFRDRIRVLSADQSLIQMSPRAVVVGLQTHCRSQLQFQGEVECFVIAFQPTGLQRLFSTPVDQLTDRAYDAHSVLGAFVSQLEQRLGDTQTFGQRVRIADQAMLRYSLRARAFDRISAAVSQTLTVSGNVRIPGLARDAGLSVRQLDPAVKEMMIHQLNHIEPFGHDHFTVPKTFFRILRCLGMVFLRLQLLRLRLAGD